MGITYHVGPPTGNTGHLNVGRHGHETREARRRFDGLDWAQQRAVSARRDALMDLDGYDGLGALRRALDEAPASLLTAAQRAEYDRLCGHGAAWRDAYHQALALGGRA